ncbi:hypothetical protein [Nocardioides convexus]|uniref:hypothetical protein n=1 Tax=Nocardioides convexus TaxID=2712224 RepID=UPI00241884DF|nr:hypothetical protein [Nocardioides convexus]
MTGTSMYPAFAAPSEKALRLFEEMKRFLAEEVFPAEESYARYREEQGPEDHTVPPVVEELKAKARERGLWNLFLPSDSGLTQAGVRHDRRGSPGGAWRSRRRRSTARRRTPATWSCCTSSAPRPSRSAG